MHALFSCHAVFTLFQTWSILSHNVRYRRWSLSHHTLYHWLSLSVHVTQHWLLPHGDGHDLVTLFARSSNAILASFRVGSHLSRTRINEGVLRGKGNQCGSVTELKWRGSKTGQLSQTDRQAGRQTNRQANRHTDGKQAHRRKMHRQRDRQTDRQTDRQADRQTGRQADQQTGK